MKKRVWKGKRLFSLLLAFVMLASIMPQELLVGAIGTPADSAENADVSVVMSAEPEKEGLSGSSTVALAVALAGRKNIPLLSPDMTRTAACTLTSCGRSLWSGLLMWMRLERRS